MIFSPNDIDNIKQFYKDNGYCIIQILAPGDCIDLIREQHREIISKQPIKDPLKLGDAPLNQLIGPFDAKRIKYYKDRWPLHQSFGACSDPQVFHLPGVWEIRQDPLLYNIACKLCNTTKLWVELNRSFHRLPGQNRKFFCRKKNPRPNSIHCKVHYNDSVFSCVPKSHNTPYETIEQIPVKAGCVVVWHPDLLQGLLSRSINDTIEYGCYLGYFPAKSHPDYLKLAGVTEKQDRINSYTYNRSPILWTSLRKVYYYPMRYQNFPHHLDAYINRLDLTSQWCPMIVNTFKNKKHLLPHIVKTPPPKLTALGELLLGITNY